MYSRLESNWPIETAEHARLSDISTIGRSVATIAEVVLLLWLIRTITTDQEERMASREDSAIDTGPAAEGPAAPR